MIVGPFYVVIKNAAKATKNWQISNFLPFFSFVFKYTAD